MLQSRGFKGRCAVAVALFVAAVGGAVVSHTPLTMSQGFEKALHTSRSELTFKSPHDNKPGDEGYWLTRAEVQSHALFAKPVTVGDRITISGVDGVERKLQVVDVKAMGAAPKTGANDTVSLLLVTAQIADETADKATVRFIVEGQIAKLPPQPVSKAL